MQKLTIQPNKYKEKSVNISFRLPKDMLEDIEILAKDTNKSRNEIIIRCLEFALDNTER